MLRRTNIMNENLVWTYERRCKKVVEALQKKGFEAIYCENKEAARKNIIEEARNADSVGFGGSVTVQELQVEPELAQMGKELLQHNRPGLSPEETVAIRHRQLSCDLFLTGSNAVTIAGQLVNVDGVGNRVGAMTFGPKKVIVVAGRNKIVEDVDAALKRIKAIAVPANARRLSLKLPCGVTGYCNDCDTPQCISRVTVIIDRKPSLSDIRVLIVNDDLGY
jgi:L-lactate utilization protein LutB